jgi:peptide/nickel transport system permease protein
MKYVFNMLTFQFGYSFFTGRLISDEIVIRLSNTLMLVVTAEILAIIIGVVLGVIAARRRGGIFDSLSVLGSIITHALPVFWIGLLLLLIFSYYLGWFPGAHSIPPEWSILYEKTRGLPSPLLMVSITENFAIRIPSLTEIAGRFHHLFLPSLTLVILLFGGYALLTRASMLEVLSEDYVVTARAKGLSERTVLFKHTLKNASLPLITEIAIAFGFMLSGAIVTETVFTYPGIGMWIWRSIDFFDFPALQSIFYIIALCVIIANFLADIVYGLIDPRIKYG